jgi:protein-S-isoprenylcysteine O-methyltransferase Ste14
LVLMTLAGMNTNANLSFLLKIAAYCAYLAAWLALAIGAAMSLRKQAARAQKITVAGVIGSLLQVMAIYLVTRSMDAGPLHAGTVALAGALVLAPLGAVVFLWAVRSAGDADALVTGGAYAWLRNPMYLAFLAMLVATGLLVSAGVKMIVPVLVYVVGSELRIASEEAELSGRFPEEYAEYKRRTRWRYLPWVR